MTGPKLNEKSYVAGERSGTKATARYVRTSASKARAVLDLIRGLPVTSADEVLQFTDRHVARDVRKVLASAVANAVNNDDQDAEELYVVACFADEGPTLRRFRPRARGRATRINKRTCHITVIVARMSDERIEILTARQERAGGSGGRGRPQSSSASRRARVERSRQQAAEQAAAETDGDDDVVDAVVEEEAPETVDGEFAGSVPATDDGEAPEGYPIKANTGSQQYHEAASKYFRVTQADLWFDTVESAEAAGFTDGNPDAAAVETTDEEAPTEAEATTEADEEDK
jgi:large subunit ribosomal protein L22